MLGCIGLKFNRKNISSAVLVAWLGFSAAFLLQESLAASSRHSGFDSISINLPTEADNFKSLDVAGVEARIIRILESRSLTPAQWQRLFAVYTGETLPASAKLKPAVMGAYGLHEEGIRFWPRFPFVRGVAYSVKFDLDFLASLTDIKRPPSAGTFLSQTFVLPKLKENPSTRVTTVYPTTDRLPENLLKFYLYFSAPMSRGTLSENVHLLDDAGKKVPAVFLELDQELWDPATQRVTLFLDPARIKRGLRSHNDLGMALKVEQKYTLLIQRDLPDAEGNRLVADFRKFFSVIVADRISPNYEKWQVSVPAEGSVEALVIRFDEALDHALSGRMLKMRKASGELIFGNVSISEMETQWEFAPEQPWQSGDYRIEVDAALEDLAGNKLNRVFDVDTAAGDKRGFEKQVVLSFTVGEKESAK